MTLVVCQLYQLGLTSIVHRMKVFIINAIAIKK